MTNKIIVNNAHVKTYLREFTEETKNKEAYTQNVSQLRPVRFHRYTNDSVLNGYKGGHVDRFT